MLPIIFVISILATIGALINTEQMNREMPIEDLLRRERADRLRSFDWISTQYLQANPSHNGVATWATLAAAPTTPPGMASATVYSGFKIVGTKTKYTVCTPFTTFELNQVLATLPKREVPTVSREQSCVAPP